MIRIPKTLNWVWVGPAPIPAQDIEWMRSWLHIHRTWRGLVWTDSPEAMRLELSNEFDVRELPPLVNRDIYNDIMRWVGPRATIAARSDIARMEIIARYGGIYLDTDVECFKDATELFNDVELFFAEEWGPNIPEPTRPLETASNYLFGATPNHPALWNAVGRLGKHLARGNIGPNQFQKGVLQATGPEYLAPILREHPACVAFPFQFFMPVCAWWQSLDVEIWPQSAYANHHCSGKWYDRIKSALPDEFKKSS